MTQVNILEAKTDLSKLVKMLETKQEDIIYLTRNGTAVAQMTLIPKETSQKRIGIAEGKFKVPDEFDSWDKEIEEMFEGGVFMSAIKLENVTRDYGGGKGIFDVSFNVNQGEVFGFLGPNGAGKTTTIRHLMGFLKPKEGRCTIDGLDCWKDRDKIQQRLGYIPGEISFFDDMTGMEFLRFLADYRGIGSKIRQKELLERFELNPKGKIKKMSKGMKQKIGIVAAFMHDPEVLILDEPTSGLDPLMQNRFIELLEEEKEHGKTILISSHMFEEVERTCHRVGIIRAGKLVAVDSVDTLRERHVRPYTVTLEVLEEAEAFAKDFGGIREGLKVTVTTKQSLEEIFMHYYGGGKND